MKQFKYNENNHSGLYRHRISICKRILTKDALLQEIETFEDYGRYWAMIKTLKGSEIMGAGREQTKVEKRFVIKYAKSLDEFINTENTSFVIVQNEIVYDVKSAINDDDMNITITIVAEGRS
ncbi:MULTISPECIES: phage head closure protein [Lysinibacillus]|uniref:phage head closure protein n=1 Tax=Lysinibacillus TaxID=400634 RepID=UPI001C3059E2|nr:MULTISPECIES: phage head closure protein [Lysinibacillus]MCK1987161.1 phage head closure protein [Lysinibacillus fusiformis]